MIATGLQLQGQFVLVAGARWAARHVVARYVSAGAQVLRAHHPHELEGHGHLLSEVRLLVAVDDEAAGWEVLEEIARRESILLSREQAARRDGGITLLGGGPGSSDLLTVRGAAALANADVVFHDRLGPGHDLAALAPGAQLVDVGKAPGNHKVPQERINELLIAEARAGRDVVRLKGGDPFVFGRGSEERDAALAAGLKVQVIPGISSAISVPGAAGIPVTARGVSKAFTVVSGHDPFTETELGHLAGIGGTLVLLMGVATLQQNAAGLLRNGLAADTPAAIVERGFCDTQRSTRATLGTLAAAARLAGCSNPAVIVIGGVAALGAGADDVAALLPAAVR